VEFQRPGGPAVRYLPSTAQSNDNVSDTVLLPASASNQGTERYVLGPAGITRSAIKSARAQLVNNQWAVNITLTHEGALQWDTLAQQQFHAIIGIDVGGKVVSAPITEPSQPSFSSFNGQMQVSGSFTEQQAKALAAQL
jgi:preprotein translocase subunit SecD